MENQPPRQDQFDFDRIVASTLLFGTLGIATIFLVKSFWFNICLSFVIFLSVQFYKFYASSGFELEELSDYQLKEYLLTYQKLKRWVLYTGACILFCVLTYIYKPSNTLFAIPYLLSLFYLLFYAPILIYYFFNFASKHSLVAATYAQRSLINTEMANPTSISVQDIVQSTIKPIHSLKATTLKKPNHELYEQLQDFILSNQASLLPRHIRILKQAQDIFQYIAAQKNHVSFSEFRKLNLHQELALKTFKDSTEQYFCIPANERDQYHQQLSTVPNLWLSQKLNQALEQLIQDIAFLYQGNLQSLADHMQFLDQRFNETEEDFKVHSKTSKH